MPDIIGFIAILTAGVGTLAGLFAAVKKVTPTFRGIADLARDWAGEPARAGVAARPGVMERLASIDTKVTAQGERIDEHTEALAAIHHELHPNSGKSFRDAMDRVERNTASPVTTVTVIHPPAADAA